MSPSTALEVRALSKRYGDRTVVDKLDLTVAEGDVYGFLGPNGAGKTTAMRAMLGLIARDSGDVRFFDEDDPVRARRHIGAIIETPAFHGWLSGRRNLRQAAAYAGLTPAETPEEVERVLARVGLSERADDKAQTYSLGMKQRLAIARALLGRPRMMLLDEPTNGLDPRGMREMRELIRSLALHDRITILVSSHMLGEVQQICNRVGIIQLGQLRAEGRVEDLLGASVGDAEGVAVEVGSPNSEALAATLAAMNDVHVVGAGHAGRTRVLLRGLDTATLASRLVTAGIALSALVPVERDLEDVFMEVTR